MSRFKPNIQIENVTALSGFPSTFSTVLHK